MKLKKISDIIKSIGAPNKDDTLLGVFNGKTAQKSIEDILKVADYTALQNQPITILSEDFKVTDLKENSLYFINKSDVKCLSEDGSELQSLYAGLLILTGRNGEAQIFDAENTFYVNDLSNGNWYDLECSHITTSQVNELLADLGDYNITYTSPSSKKSTTQLLSNFARNTLLKTMTLDSTALSSTIRTSGKYNIYTTGTLRLGHPNAPNLTPLEIKVNKGDTIYLKFSRTDTESLCDIVYIGDIAKNIPDDADYEYSTVDVWSGQLGFAIGATEYDTTFWEMVEGAQGTAYKIDDYLLNLPCARTGGLVYSTKEEIGRPEFRAVTLGNGLKFENGVLSLDIENGDNLKYGTSKAQAEETNGNEVVSNE